MITLKGSQLSPPFHAFVTFLRDEGSNSGLGMIQRWWKFSCPLSKDLFQLIWSIVYVLSSISATMFIVTFMITNPSKLLKKHLITFTKTVTSSLKSAYRMTSFFHVNTHSATMFTSFENMALLMDFVLQLWRTNISKLWRTHGDDWENGRLCAKCWSLMSEWISSQHDACFSNLRVCWKQLVSLLFHIDSV